MASSLNVLFRIVYATLYTLLHIIVVALLLITPADLINQARTRHNVYPILIVSAVYVGSILIVVFVYFARLYITRSVLNSIPKAWIPVDRGDVAEPVRRMVVAGLSRSAAVAFASRPRLWSEGEGEGEDKAPADDASSQPGSTKVVQFDAPVAADKARAPGLRLLPAGRAVWGSIEHGGWAPPPASMIAFCGGTPHDDPPPLSIPPLLQYSTVVAELPALVEATALTLAPRDPTSSLGLPPPPDAAAMDLLQRPAHMSLRDYLAHLTVLGVLNAQDRGALDSREEAGEDDQDKDARPLGAVVLSFVAAYEYARFSTQPLTHAAFMQLMHDLATILRRIRPLNPDLIYLDEDYGDSDDDEPYSADDASLSGREMLSDGHYDGDDDAAANDAGARRPSPGSRPRPSGRRARTRRRPHQQPPPSRARSASTGTGASSISDRFTASSSSSGGRRGLLPPDEPYWQASQTSGQTRRSARPRMQGQGRSQRQSNLLQPPAADRSSSASALSRSTTTSSTSSSTSSTKSTQFVGHGPSGGGGGAVSIRSTASGATSGSSGSVIRLADQGEARARGLPFVLMPAVRRNG